MMSGDGEKKDKRIKRLKGYLLYGAEKFKVALLRNVYPKFSVDFSWVNWWCSYHPFHAVYSPINHPITPSKNLYFRGNFGSKLVGDDNLIFHAVCRVTDENGKNYLSGRVLGRWE